MPKLPKNIEAVELGLLLRLDIYPSRGEPWSMEFPRGKHPHFYWAPKQKILLFHFGASKSKSDVASKAQVRSYRTWHDAEPNAARVESIDIKETKWERLGEVRRVDYRSTKWGRSDEYTHDSRGGTVLWRLGGANKKALYQLRGKMRATADGLIR